MRKLHSLISLLLVLLMLAPCALADAPLLQAASDWNLADTPLSVTLSISLQAHAPFDETRTAMLDRVLAPLSLNLYAADGESGVSVLMNGNELLTMAQKGDAVQFSCMPNVSYASLDGNALELLLGTSSNSIDLRAVDGTFEKWIDDGWVLSNAILEPFAEYGKRKSVKTTIKDMGLARSCTDYTFSKSKLEEMQQTLLSLCPEGDLHDLIASLTFSGTQKLRVYRTEDEVPLRVEYNGVCGVDGKLRTVKLVWRTKRESGETRDEITLTSPAKSGTDKNTLDFERIMTFSSGKITMQGTCSYKVTASKQTTQTSNPYPYPTKHRQARRKRQTVRKRAYGCSLSYRFSYVSCRHPVLRKADRPPPKTSPKQPAPRRTRRAAASRPTRAPAEAAERPYARSAMPALR